MLLLRTLGGLSLEIDGRPGEGAAAQRGRLVILAAIAAAGDAGISRDRLHALFWPESDSDRARNALNQAIHALRRDSGAGELLRGTSTLRLNALVVECDLLKFNQALAAGDRERAVGTYRGDFLDGIHLREAPGAERWAETERERIATRYRTTLRELAERAGAEGRATDAVRWWERLAAVDRVSAAVAVSLMRAHAANGDSPAALRYAMIYETTLHEDLGVEPDASVTSLAQLLRATLATATAGNGAGVDVVVPIARESQLEADSSRAVIIRQPQPGADPSRPFINRPRRAGIIAAALVSFLAPAAVARLTPAPLNARGIILSSVSVSGEDQSLAWAHTLLSARIAEGIASLGLLDPVVDSGDHMPQSADALAPLELARAAGVRFAVTTSVLRSGARIVLRADVGDAITGTSLAATTNSSDSTVDAALISLQGQVKAALAARVNPMFARWSSAASMPARWESIDELSRGIEAWQQGRMGIARSRFLSSAALDTVAATPLVWAAYASDTTTAVAFEDSIRTQRRNTGAWDRAMLSYLRSVRSGDTHAIYAAAHEVLEAATGSEFALLVAQSALIIGRASEALRILDQLNPDTGVFNGSIEYWRVRTGAHHYLGQYAEELRAARAALQRAAGDRIFMQAEIKALSGLGRIDEVIETCERALQHPARPGWNWQPCDQAVYELAAHGHRKAARNLAVWLLKSAPVTLEVSKTETQLAVAEWLLVGGEVDSAQGALSAIVPRTPSDSATGRWLQAWIHATKGNRAEVESFLAAADSTVFLGASLGEPSISRAQLYALLGSRDEAVAWTSRGFREGFAWRNVLHVFPGFDRLVGYGPYDALIAPDDDPERAPVRIARRTTSPR